MIRLTLRQKIFTAAVVVAVIAVPTAYIVRKRSLDAKTSTNGQSEESKAAEKADVDTKKEEILSNQDDAVVAPNSDKTEQSIPVQKDVTAKITTLSQENGQVTIAGAIAGTTEAGACTFKFTTPQDKPVSKTIKGVIAGDSVNCGPLSIPETSFSYLGNWTANLTYYLDSGKSVSAEKVISIK